MDPNHLRTLDEWFTRAMEHPASDRVAWLRATCPDRAVCEDVITLLDADADADRYFDRFSQEIGQAASSEIESNARDHLRIGPYQTIALIGSGGMGTVFLAERADGQFAQRVALKLIRLGMDTDEAVRRFLAERQIVARLTHPAIARLLDGGVAEDGRPYFVLEHVDGVPITDYCDGHALSLAERIELVISTADAVQYAHRNLVVHRDVKPSNVLVTTDGAVKLLDFGIAKLLTEAEGAASRDLTRTDQRVLTPLYAAPEQIAGHAVTTATDVYSLGVLLYELLTGRRPHELDGRSSTEFERVVLVEEPPKPSQVTISTAVASARRVTPERLSRALRGDLDTIVQTALRKEPDRRYQSALQLADDLRRFLDGRPIAAQADRWSYRASKFVSRHRVAVSLAAVAAVVVAAFVATLTVQSIRLARERDKAQQVASLFVDLFEVADPSEARGASVTAREVLDRGVERIQQRLRDQPEVQSALLEVIGRVYRNLGLYGRAAPLVQGVLDTRRRTLGPEHQDVAVALSDLGELLRLRGEYKAADQTLREALAMFDRLAMRTSAGAARAMNHLGKVLYATGALEEAERVSRDARVRAAATLGDGHEEVAESLNTLAAVKFARGADAEAEPLFRQALAIRRARLGNDHPLVPAALNNLASLLSRKGDHRAAEGAYREALEIYRRLFGAEHPRVATTMNNLALSYFARRDYATAEPLMRDALATRRRLLDQSHPDLAQSAANLGLLLQTTSRLDEASVLYEEALAIRRRTVGESHPLYAQSLHNLGLLKQAQSDSKGAEVLFRQALSILLKALGPAHALVATSHHDLAVLLLARGDRDGASRHFQDALAIRQKLLPPAHPERRATEQAIAALPAHATMPAR